ncbi:hypothetical protein BT96DRAFT_949591 [Gymnopus androsaceus JB14]|uniref:Uncharacterized protein n=1 Tax=Gymnopus androsaceus JB14 TaxID=1447944 RepID=A0A6A4GJA7_9AGAR|nr:hypothetical protein BT96DRAFT_949591 [Gymnopus androsaceus JB14]
MPNGAIWDWSQQANDRAGKNKWDAGGFVVEDTRWYFGYNLGARTTYTDFTNLDNVARSIRSNGIPSAIIECWHRESPVEELLKRNAKHHKRYPRISFTTHLKTLKSARRGIPQLVGRLSAPGDFDFLDLIRIFVEEHELACLESEDLGAVFEGGELDGVDEGADEEGSSFYAPPCPWLISVLFADIQPRLTKTATSSSNAQLYCTTPLPIPSKSTLELQAQPSTSSPASTLLPVSSASSAPHVSAFLGSLSHSPASVLMSTARADAEPAQTAGNKYKNGQKHEKQRAKRAKDRATQEGPSAATLSHVLSPETAVEVELDAGQLERRGARSSIFEDVQDTVGQVAEHRITQAELTESYVSQQKVLARIRPIEQGST